MHGLDRNREWIGNIELLVGYNADQDGGDTNINESADRQTAYNTDRHITPWIPCLCRSCRDRFKPDIGEEYD